MCGEPSVPERKDIEQNPSEWMADAFAQGGSIVQECHCGREHFVDDHDWMEHEIVALRKRAAKQPTRCIGHTEDCFVRYAEIDGKVFVIGCPCNGLRLYEDWLWQHRRGIASYLAARAVAQKVAAEFDHALVGDLPNAVSGT